jgi:hypothetical protein
VRGHHGIDWFDIDPALTKEELLKKPTKELKRLAKKTKACKGNLARASMADSLSKFYVETAGVDTPEIRRGGREQVPGEDSLRVAEQVPGKQWRNCTTLVHFNFEMRLRHSLGSFGRSRLFASGPA